MVVHTMSIEPPAGGQVGGMAESLLVRDLVRVH